ncbi:Penicillin binding protein transpeptidase domain [Acididesulfobacillus acetoxydans]|uniref:Penicillin binding protein transpeptidase domain n=1 Tax=Acididesulfobacillus acetoxydans TaxID=1561005 RepID=A0A8S0WKL6_9FIRM|nr:Penicillin binding protein transpeptidase domain [Acididesulfobacillus acetoxydans]CEJ06731.1 Penicillin-binding protein A [Acididesulfobacillus acetoxydans]
MGMVLCFFVLSLGLVYWQVVQNNVMLKNPANPRLALMERRIKRGGIFDRNGVVLAESKVESGKSVRVYPNGGVYEPLLGYATLQHGQAGLEDALSGWLLGMKNPTLSQELKQFFQVPRQGDDVVLTLDAKIQQAAYDGLQGKKGAAVAVDPRTGQILALASQPSFDPNSLDKNWKEISRPGSTDLLNNALSLFTPGSVMKLVTSKALFSGGIDTSKLFDDKGTTVINGQVIPDENTSGNGWINYNLALAYSSNVYFATQTVKAGQDNFLAAAKAYGFGQTIPFPLPVPDSQITNKAAVPTHLSINQLAASAFGQGQVLVTPLHMALITAAVADHGVMMRPYLVDRVLDSRQNVLYKAQPKPWLTPLSPADAGKITTAMVTTVNQGTAAAVALPNVQVAAKTGSAQPGGNVTTNAWFVAFAPADNPQIAVAVLVEHGGAGGVASAPIAKAMIKVALAENL